MAEKSMIRDWHGRAATFVEDDKNGKIVVTVDDERVEMAAAEWDGLPSYQGTVPNSFDKPPSKT